jgi:Domain of unknown function (DUF4375)
MPERITRAELEDEISDNQVETLWSLPFERLLAKGLDGTALIDALTAGQRAVYRVVAAQDAIHNGGVSHLYEREHLATPELVEAAERIGAADYARFFDEVIRGREEIQSDPSLETQLTDRFYDLSTYAGEEHLNALTPLVLAYANQHPDEFFEP